MPTHEIEALVPGDNLDEDRMLSRGQMNRTKIVVPTLPDTIRQILEKLGVQMEGFTSNVDPEPYNWQFPKGKEGTPEEQLRTADLIPKHAKEGR